MRLAGDVCDQDFTTFWGSNPHLVCWAHLGTCYCQPEPLHPEWLQRSRQYLKYFKRSTRDAGNGSCTYCSWIVGQFVKCSNYVERKSIIRVRHHPQRQCFYASLSFIGAKIRYIMKKIVQMFEHPRPLD